MVNLLVNEQAKWTKDHKQQTTDYNYRHYFHLLHMTKYTYINNNTGKTSITDKYKHSHIISDISQSTILITTGIRYQIRQQDNC